MDPDLCNEPLQYSLSISIEWRTQDCNTLVGPLAPAVLIRVNKSLQRVAGTPHWADTTGGRGRKTASWEKLTRIWVTGTQTHSSRETQHQQSGLRKRHELINAMTWLMKLLKEKFNYRKAKYLFYFFGGTQKEMFRKMLMLLFLNESEWGCWATRRTKKKKKSFIETDSCQLINDLCTTTLSHQNEKKKEIRLIDIVLEVGCIMQCQH